GQQLIDPAPKVAIVVVARVVFPQAERGVVPQELLMVCLVEYTADFSAQCGDHIHPQVVIFDTDDLQSVFLPWGNPRFMHGIRGLMNLIPPPTNLLADS